MRCDRLSVVSTIIDPEKWTSEWVTAVATAVMAVFTVVLVLVTNRQAKLTKRTADIAEAALLKLERALILFKGLNPRAFIYPETHSVESWIFLTEWENAGGSRTQD